MSKSHIIDNYLIGILVIRIPIKSRVVCGFSPTNGSRNRYVFREMDVYPVLSRIYGNWTEHVSGIEPCQHDVAHILDVN